MKEIALHLLDIVQNSVRADASHVDIRFLLGADGVLEMGVRDDGCGMGATKKGVELMARPKKNTVDASKIIWMAQKGHDQMCAPFTGDGYDGFVRVGQAKELFRQILELCNAEVVEGVEDATEDAE